MKRRIAVVVLAGLTLAGPALAFAQDARLDAAKKEGKVEVHRTGSERILQRVMQELQAGIKNVDVVHTSDAGHYVFLKDKKLLARYTPAGTDRFPPGFKDKDGYWYGLRATVTVITYNTKGVTAAEAPKTWKDLLDPRWKGKLVTAHPGYSGVIMTHVLALANLLGWDYFKTLAQNRVMLVQSAADPPSTVASGERLVAVNGGEYSAYQVRKKGAPIELVYPKEGVPLVVSPSAITVWAPHPNAARLFTDFTFTREVQQVMADSEGLYSGHAEVTYPADKPKFSELKLLTVDPEELEKRNEEIKKRFVEFFGA